ncbi:hypothetical protein MGN70_001271 [Eutypa lata]|nr:hypothetical protein MGN70_001271 [Eutypa lata]
MGFSGPGIYEIVPYQAPNLSMNAWDGLMQAGAEVKTYNRNRDDPSTNALWQLALVSGSGDSSEYLIINVRTGFFLTATSDKKVTTTPQISPTDPSCHWTIKSMPANGYDVYTVNNKVSSRGQLNVTGSSNKSGTEIIAWPIENTDNTKWYFESH